jgi:eukaryotic-like serine/threonine-protein kinase
MVEPFFGCGPWTAPWKAGCFRAPKAGGDPFWAPDSRSIGFFAGAKLKRISADGSALQTLCDATPGRGGAWNADGVILFTPAPASALYQVSANGGTPRAATELDRNHLEYTHRWPKFLPDGRHFLFFVRDFQPERSGIYVGTLDSKEIHLVVKTTFGAAFVANGTILYVQNETLFAQAFDIRKLTTTGEPVPLPERVAVNPGSSAALFTASDNGTVAYYPAVGDGGPFKLAWYSRDGKGSEPLAAGYFYGPALSPDGTRAVVPTIAADGLSSDLWNYDLVRGTKSRLTSGPGFKIRAVWQSDGQAVIFSAILRDVPHIYRMKSDGTGTPETLLQSDGITESPWSACRDDRYLAYTRGLASDYPKTSVWILSLMGDRQPFPLVQSQFTDSDPAFSPDCKWVAYRSNESGQWEIYLTHFPDATRRFPVSTKGGRNPHWRGDGKELFYFSPEHQNMMAVSVEEKGQEITLGAPHALFSIPSGQPLGNLYDVTSDGQRFLLSTNTSTANVPLTLVVNWDAELKR